MTNTYQIDLEAVREEAKHAPRQARLVTKKGLVVEGEKEALEAMEAEDTEEDSRLQAAMDDALELLETLRQEELAERPGIWERCEDAARQHLLGQCVEGKIIDFAKLNDARELYTRKLALEQVVNYGLSEGMTREAFEVLFLGVLGKDGYEEMVNGAPPSREAIDDLRLRVYVITQADAPVVKS